MIPRDLRAALADPVSPEALLGLVRDLADQRRIVSTGPRLKLAGHVASFSPADRALWQRLKPWLEERGAAPFTPAELAREAHTSEAVIKALLQGRRGSGEVWRIVGERFLLGEQVAALAARAAVVGEAVGGTGFTAAQYRDAIGTGRGWAIHILEFFDGLGVTARRGDLRRMRPDYETLVGPADPYTPAS